MANGILTEIAFWRIVVAESRCTVLCEPDMESRVKGWVDARGLGGIITVRASPICPEGRIVVLDTSAIEASLNEAMYRNAAPREMSCYAWMNEFCWLCGLPLPHSSEACAAKMAAWRPIGLINAPGIVVADPDVARAQAVADRDRMTWNLRDAQDAALRSRYPR